MTNIVNLTPHTINIMGAEKLDIPASGIIARVESTDTLVGTINCVPVFHASFGEVIDLPEPAENTIYVVSRMVAEAAKGRRNDLVVPYGCVRDDEGRIIGCTGFALIA